MSAITQGDSAPAGAQVVLPPGYSTGPVKETTSSNALGQVVQGVQVPLTFPNGSQVTVFVPYGVAANQQQVQALFDQRIAQVNAVAGLTG